MTPATYRLCYMGSLGHPHGVDSRGQLAHMFQVGKNSPGTLRNPQTMTGLQGSSRGPGPERALTSWRSRSPTWRPCPEGSGQCPLGSQSPTPGASTVTQTVKNLPAMQEIQVRPLSQEAPLEKGIATHSSILAWRTPWTEEPGGLQSMGSQRVGHD